VVIISNFQNPQFGKAPRGSRKRVQGADAAGRAGCHANVGRFIVATDGRVVLPYYYDHIADHPSLDLLLSGVFSTRWDRDFNGPLGGDIQE
jgi:hypothetical protein